MIQMTKFQIIPLSMVTKEGLQRVDIRYHASRPGHLQLSVYRENSAVAEQVPVALNSGTGTVSVLLPEPECTAQRLYEEIKAEIGEEAARVHPARFALCEIVNLHDEALEFEPIHRVVARTDG